MHVFVYNAHSLYCTLEVHVYVQYTYNHTSTCILCINMACMYIGERGMAPLARHQNQPTISHVEEEKNEETNTSTYNRYVLRNSEKAKISIRDTPLPPSLPSFILSTPASVCVHTQVCGVLIRTKRMVYLHHLLH